MTRGKWIRTHQFRERMKLVHKGHKRMTPEVRKKIGDANRGHIHTKAFREMQRIRKLGNKESEETKRKKSEALKGEKCYSWKGGITKESHRIRTSREYRIWRMEVIKRDECRCVWCGFTGGTLHADHIKPFALFPELRFVVDNGRTLCPPCHRTTFIKNKKRNTI